MNKRSRGPRLALALCLSAGLAPAMARAAPTPSAPPTPAEIKTCIQEVDTSGKWVFDWKSIEVAAPRHPLNNYEAFGHADRDFIGYPVHAVYSFNGMETIDATYWMNRDSAGRWQIPFICQLN